MTTPSIFYVKDNNGNLVAAQFLTYNGSYIADPNLSDAQATPIYDQNGNLISNANPNGYLIVPESYSISVAAQFGGSVKDAMTVQEFGGGGTENIYGFTAGMAEMAAAFWPGGVQDLQRSYNGITNGAFVKAFTDAASYNLGVVSAYAGLPIWASELGGGTLNVLANSWVRKIPLDELGEYGLTTVNSNSYNAGYALASTIPGNQPGQTDPSNFTAEGGTGDQFSSASISDLSNSETGISENLDNGSSQNITFNDNLDGTYTAATTGYSGANLSGTVQFTQSINIDAYGNIAANISGTGDVVTLNTVNSVTLQDGTTATIDGTGNTISMGSNDNLTVAADPNSTNDGVSANIQDTIQVSPPNASGVLPNLTTDTITFEGQAIAGSFTGSGNIDSDGRTYTIEGTSLVISDGSDSLTVNNFVNGDYGVFVNSPYSYSPISLISGAGISGTEAIAMNDSGEIIGEYFDSSHNLDYFLNNNGSITSLSSLPGVPVGLTDSGVIAGNYSNGTGFTDNNGVFTAMPNKSGATRTEIDAISSSGQYIAGEYEDSSGGWQDYVYSVATSTFTTFTGQPPI